MLVKNATVNDLYQALGATQTLYDFNLEFRNIEQQGKNVRFTLTVKDSKGTGARRSSSAFNRGRRVKAACWHVHGSFFDYLFQLRPDAVITSMGRKITIEDGNWQDWEVGPMIAPMWASQACECSHNEPVTHTYFLGAV